MASDSTYNKFQKIEASFWIILKYLMITIKELLVMILTPVQKISCIEKEKLLCLNDDPFEFIFVTN